MGICKELSITEEEYSQIYMNYLSSNKEFVNNLQCNIINTDLITQINRNFQEYISLFPFIKFFTHSFGTNIGEFVETYIVSNIFKDFKRVTKKNYDGTLINDENIKIEVKTIRALNNSKNKNYLERACFSYENYALSNSTFQQVKPNEFTYMLGFVIYKDVINIYVIHRNQINATTYNNNDNLIKMYPQHKGNVLEGQIHIKHLDKYIIGQLKRQNDNIAIEIKNIVYDQYMLSDIF